MAASTANRNYPGRVATGKSNLSYPLGASAHIFRGTIVIIDNDSAGHLTDGLVIPFAAYDASYFYCGIACAEVWNLAGVQSHVKGDRIPVSTSGTVYLDAAGVDKSWMGKPVYATDDHTVVLNAATPAMYVGRVIDIISTTMVEVEIDTDQQLT